eukprot:CFRG0569T1
MKYKSKRQASVEDDECGTVQLRSSNKSSQQFSSWDTRFGALEILAVYTGTTDDGSVSGKQFGFVRLMDDILFGDKDDEDEIEVEWLNEVEGKEKDGHILLQYMGMDDVGYAAIGALICPVTDLVRERDDGSVIVTAEALTFVDIRLQKQLSDDYDPSEEAQDADYATRMRKSGRKRIKVERVVSEVKERKVNAKNTSGTKSKGRNKGASRDGKISEGGRAKKESGAKRGGKAIKRENILVPSPGIDVCDDVFMTKTGKINSFGGDVERASKEVIRAVRSGDAVAFKKLIKSPAVHSLHSQQSIDLPYSAIDYAIVCENMDVIDILWEDLNTPSGVARADMLPCSLVPLSTGKQTSKYAEYNRSKVNASRGGREGNNAFVCDLQNGQYKTHMEGMMPSGQRLTNLMCTFDPVTVEFWDHIEKLSNGKLVQNGAINFHKLITHGDITLAQYIMKRMVDKGLGLNQLHVDVMGEGHELESTVRVASIVKMSNASSGASRFAPIHCAAANPNITYIEQLIAIAPDSVNCADSYDANLLHYACAATAPTTLDYLLAGPGSSLAKNKATLSTKTTPLMWAARAARAGCVRSLCRGEEANTLSSMHRAMDSTGYTALHHAVCSGRAGRVETIQAMLDCGADVNVRADTRVQSKVTPLMLAAARGDVDVIDVLVAGGATLTVRDKLERTCLMFAAKNGHAHVLAYLLRKGVDPDALDSSDNSALHYATAYGWVGCVRLLINEGKALPDVRNNWMTTPLALALKKNRLACASILLQLTENVDVNIRDKEGTSLFTNVVHFYATDLANASELHDVAQLGMPWVLQRMLERQDLDVSIADKGKQTVLHILARCTYTCMAAEEKAMELIEVLLSRGVDVLAADEQGDIPFDVAVKQTPPSLSLAKRFLTHTSHKGVVVKSDTVLHTLMCAVNRVSTKDEGLYMDVFYILRESLGEEVFAHCANVVNNSGMTPLLLAIAQVQSNWTHANTTSTRLLDKLIIEMSTYAGAIVERKAEFRSWELVARRITDPELHTTSHRADKNMCSDSDSDTESSSDNNKNSRTKLCRCENCAPLRKSQKLLPVGVVTKLNWKPEDEFDTYGGMSAFHIVTMVDDVKWSARMCDNLIAAIGDKSVVASILNAKAAKTGEMPVNNILRQLVRMIKERKKTVYLDEVISLLKSLGKAGANINSLMNPFFQSESQAKNYMTEVTAEEVDEKSESDMLQRVLPVNAASTDLKMEKKEEALECIRQFVIDREKVRICSLLQSSDERLTLSAQFTPPFHALLTNQTCPPESFFDAMLGDETTDLSPSLVDLEGNTALHIAATNGCLIACMAINANVMSVNVDAVNDSGDTAFIIACREGHLKQVKLLHEYGANIQYINPKIGGALHAAVSCQREDVVAFLLQKEGVDLEIGDSDGRTALHLAVSLSACSAAESLNPIDIQLLKAGANVNAQDVYGRTPLHYAFVRLDVDMKCDFPPLPSSKSLDPIDTLMSIITYDCRLDVTDIEGRNVLHLACAMGASVCALTLLEMKSDLGCMKDADGNTPLAFAMLSQRAYTAILLISKDAGLDMDVHRIKRIRLPSKPTTTKTNNATAERTIKIVSEEKHTPLWHALSAGQELQSVARYMLARQKLIFTDVLIDLFACRKFQLALKQIQQCRSPAIISLVDKDGMSLLHRLAQVSSFAEAPRFAQALADALITGGVDPHVKDNDGNTALHTAAYYGHYDLVKHLADEYDVNVDELNNKHTSALASMFMGQKADTLMAYCLLEKSKSPSKMINLPVWGKRSSNTTHSARFKDTSLLVDMDESKTHGKLAVMRRLTQEMKNTDIEPNKDMNSTQLTVQSTCLVEAALIKNQWLINLLLSYGANAKACDEDLQTSLHAAVLTNNIGVVQAILRWGRVPINALDREGRSALHYAVALAAESSSWAISECLLAFGASPLSRDGNESPLHIAVRHNKVRIVNAMLNALCTSIKQTPVSKVVQPKKGDVVWARFVAQSTRYTLCNVVDVDGDTLSLIVVRNPETVQPLETKFERRINAVDVNRAYVHAVKKDVDILMSSKNVIMSNWVSKDDHSDSDKTKLLEEYEGFEQQLVVNKTITNVPELQDVLMSVLLEGQYVAITTQEGTEQIIAEIKAAYVNGQYCVQPLRGLAQTMSRIDIRPLRQELDISTLIEPMDRLGDMVRDEGLAHLCVRPVSFGSYDNVDMLETLLRFGVPADVQDVNGKTPLELACPESKLAARLREVTNTTPLTNTVEAMSVDKNEDVCVQVGGVNLQADAELEWLALHEEGADDTEIIIPTVNPVCGQTSAGLHVLKIPGEELDFYDVVLSKVDVEYGRYGKFVFYKMQIICDPVQNVYILLTNWGRIGDEGIHQESPFQDQHSCEQEFAKVFKSKTGNEWMNRGVNSFERKTKKYQIVRTPRTRVANPKKLLPPIAEGATSYPAPQLDSSLADTLRAFLDVDALSAAASNSSMNQRVLAFGQLSATTLQNAEEKLKEASAALDILERAQDRNSNATANDIRAAWENVAKITNEFYELIPMNEDTYGVPKTFSRERYAKMSPLNMAVELVHMLKDLSIVRQVLLGARYRREEMHPIDYAYKALDTQIKLLPLASDEHKCLLTYIDNTCSDSDVVVNHIYTLSRTGDADLTNVGIDNRQLLFHGSKNTNMCGILAQGLRIAPPDAPRSGLAFGKGVYFADQFKKAFGYTSGLDSTQYEQPRAFILIAEVALGEQHRVFAPQYMENAPEGKHSTLAVGKELPDVSRYLVVNSLGAKVPLGKLRKAVVPEIDESDWLTKARWGTRKESIDADSRNEIERARLDPNTCFPHKVTITHNDKPHVAILEHGPRTQQANMWDKEDLEKRTGDISKPKTNPDDDNDMEDSDSDSDSNNMRGLGNQNGGELKDAKVLTRVERTAVSRMNEYIVYDTKQIRLRYLVEVTSKKWLKKKLELSEQE